MRWCGAVGLGLLAAGCVEPAPEVGSIELASEVGDHETSTCSTAVVIELSRQIAAEVGCMSPGQLVAFAETEAIRFAGSAVLPYVSDAARLDLLAAAADGGVADPIAITSAYRTVVQQYLLYRWFELGRCGITAAAVPGSSNHESGRAIDVSNYDAWVTRLEANRWSHSVPGDPVHFDHTMSPDLRGTDVQAFQRLWNVNFPGDVIAEDGAWGPETEARVQVAPAEGFAIGPGCAGARLDVAVVAIEAPRVLAPGAAGEVRLTLRNSGWGDWPAASELVTTPAGRGSALAAPSWPAPDRPASTGALVLPGQTVEVGFPIVAPAAEGEYTESFALAGGAERWGMISLVVQVSADGGGGGDASGGCGAGGAAGLLIPSLALLILATRKRRLEA